MTLRPLRIAVFVNRLPPFDHDGRMRAGERFGGVQVAAWSLARALADRGHEVWVFAAGQRRFNLDQGNLHVRQVPASLRVGQTPAAWRLFTEPGHHLPPPDVVLAYMGDQPAPLAARRWARRWRVPLVVSYHGDPVGGFGGPVRRLAVRLHERRLGPAVLREAAAVIALSPAAAASSRLLASVRENVRVIPNGVDPESPWAGTRAEARRALGLREDERVILSVGSLTPIKGIDVLLGAFARLAATSKDGASGRSVLLVVGDGPSRMVLERQASGLIAAGRVRFLGFVPAGAGGLFAAADVLAMPSRSEAFPLTLLEAGIAGLPAVASRLPVLEALVEDGRTGRLVPVDDSAALAAALDDLLRDDALRRRMGEAAHAWARAFTWPAVARQTEDVLRDAAGRR